jgi:hypothetical protein
MIAICARCLREEFIVTKRLMLCNSCRVTVARQKNPEARKKHNLAQARHRAKHRKAYNKYHREYRVRKDETYRYV